MTRVPVQQSKEGTVPRLYRRQRLLTRVAKRDWRGREQYGLSDASIPLL